MSEFIKEDSFIPIKQFNCSNCGASLEVWSKRAKYTGCSYCGSLLDPQSEDFQVLGALGDPGSYPSYTFLEVGMIGEFRDKKYQIIARTRWEMDYKERWMEDGEVGYSDEIWYYDEWLLLSEQKTYLYLIEDKDGFYASQEVIPNRPILPPSSNEWIKFFDHHAERPIQEIGQARVVFFEGESNYKIKTDDVIHFASYNYKGQTHIVEYRLDRETGKYVEIEFFEEEKVSRTKILKAFRNNPQAQKVFAKKLKWYNAMLISIGALIGFLGLLLSTVLMKETPVFEQRFKVDNIYQDSMMVSDPIKIASSGVYNLKLINGLTSSASTAFSVIYIMDVEASPLRALQGNFTGTSSQSVNKIVKIDQEQMLSAKIFIQKSAQTAGDVKFSISKVPLISRYFVIGLIICLISIFVFLAFWQNVKS